MRTPRPHPTPPPPPPHSDPLVQPANHVLATFSIVSEPPVVVTPPDSASITVLWSVVKPVVEHS